MSKQYFPVTLIRFSYRLFFIANLIVGGVVLAGLLSLVFGRAWQQREFGKKIISAWMRITARFLGLQIDSRGSALSEPCLIVANHISWLDIIVIGTVFPTLFVAKQEVKTWPLIGRLASLAGTIFIQRDSVAALRSSIAGIRKCLEKGGQVAVFPEGTTSNGESVLPFHNGLFLAVTNTQLPIQPLALRYARGMKIDQLAPFIDNMSFFPHLLRLICLPSIQVRLDICSPITTSLSGKAAASQALALIKDKLDSADISSA